MRVLLTGGSGFIAAHCVDLLLQHGHSVVFNGNGDLIAQGKWFEEDFVVVDTESRTAIEPIELPPEEAIYQAAALRFRPIPCP